MISKLYTGLIIFDQQNRKRLLLHKVRVIFSNHFSKLGTYYDKQHEKPRSLKPYISWKNAISLAVLLKYLLTELWEEYLKFYRKLMRSGPNTWKLHSKLAATLWMKISLVLCYWLSECKHFENISFNWYTPFIFMKTIYSGNLLLLQTTHIIVNYSWYESSWPEYLDFVILFTKTHPRSD